jgi:hypothetical protein
MPVDQRGVTFSACCRGLITIRFRKGDTGPPVNHHKNRCGEKVIRKLKSGEYRLYSRKKNPKTGKRRNLGTFSSMEKAKAHERAVQYFKRH